MSMPPELNTYTQAKSIRFVHFQHLRWREVCVETFPCSELLFFHFLRDAIIVICVRLALASYQRDHPPVRPGVGALRQPTFV